MTFDAHVHCLIGSGNKILTVFSIESFASISNYRSFAMVERSWNADFRLPHPGSITLSDGMQLGKLKIIRYLLKELEFLNYFNKFLMNFSVWDLMA